MQIPKLIQQLQQRRGETNAAFARALGIKSSYLSQLLQRKTSVEVANKYLSAVDAEIKAVLWQTITDDPATMPPKVAHLLIKDAAGIYMTGSASATVIAQCWLVKGNKWCILN